MDAIRRVLFARPRDVIRNLAVFHAVGLAIHLLPATREHVHAITPVFLLLVDAWVLAPLLVPVDRKLWAWSAAVCVMTFALEVIGVASGLVFGSYAYGKGLGVRIWGVPPVIGFNWLVVILGLTAFLSERIDNAVIASIASAAGCVLFDLVLEPVAPVLDYWRWATGHAPWQNYAAWGLIAFAASLAYHLVGLRVKSIVPAACVVIEFVFFLVLCLTLAPAGWT